MRKSIIARSAGLRISARIASWPLPQVTTSKPAFDGNALDDAQDRLLVVDDKKERTSGENFGHNCLQPRPRSVPIVELQGPKNSPENQDLGAVPRPRCAGLALCATVRLRPIRPLQPGVSTRFTNISACSRRGSNLAALLRPKDMPPMTPMTSVLIVDDEPAVRDIMARWVTALGLRTPDRRQRR